MPYGTPVGGIGPPGRFQGGMQDLPSGTPIDAYGMPVGPWQPTYVDYIQVFNGTPNPHTVRNPNYDPNASPSGGQTATPVPPSFQVTFDTIGQTIFRGIGHGRYPLRMIWAQGINVSGDTTVSPTLTFAAALCAPIDPSETGQVAVIFSGQNAIYDPDQGGIITPDGLSVEDAAALQASLSAAVVYPGDEAQLPAALIVSDKGSSITNAFRGIRYIVFPLFPLKVSTSGLSINWNRTNDIVVPNTYTASAVEFAAGSS